MLKSTWRTEYCFFLSLTIYGTISCTNNDITYVERRTQLHDKFASTATLPCNSFGAWPDSGINCTCEEDNPTFLYSKNACVNNSVVETNVDFEEGCSTFLQLHGQKPYYVADLQSPSNPQIFGVQKIKDGKCTMVAAHYIEDFTGNVMQVNVSNVFSINKRQKTFTWKALPIATHSKLRGRVIRVKPNGCTFYNYNSKEIENPCLIFKAKGTITFPVSSPSTTSSIHSSTKSSTHRVPTMTLTSRTSKTTSTVIQSAGTLSPTSTVHASSFTSSAVSPNYKPTDSGRHKDESKGQSPPIGAIVGAIFAVVGVIVIIVLVVVWRRRNHKPNEEKEKDINKDNPAYGEGEIINLSNPQTNRNNKENSDFEYDYAAVDGDPRASNGQPPPGIYQSLTHDGNRESVYTPLDRQQDNPLEESTGYDKIDHQVFQPGRKGPTDPQYNVLQRPNKNKPNHKYLEPGVHINRNKISSPRQAPQSNEPVYNVLEDPSPGGIVDEPEYNVLEDPNGQHDPEYNVLEDLKGQYEPEYNVLEAPDSDHDKGPAKGHPSSHDNVGYASTIALKPRGSSPVYAAPEGPISEPTYQPLTINAPDDSVYQPLDRRSRIVPDDQPVYHVLESATSTDA